MSHSKTDAARITKLDIQMNVPHESDLFWGQKVKGEGRELQKNRVGCLHSCECWLLL